VLRAHIAVDTAVFPAGTTGYQLDAVARMPLWQAGLDYRHGRFAAAHTQKPESPSPTPRAANKTD
jgi:Xaa-Pro aminopeptidase